MVMESNKDNFDREVLSSGIPVVVDFWAPWCGPCQMMIPIFEEISKELEGRMKFVKVSTEESPELAEKYEIRGIPCLIVFNDGKEINRIVGMQQKDSLLQKLGAHLTQA